MRFYKTRRLRIISGATLLLLLSGAPVLLGFTRPQPGHPSDMPGIVKAYATGLVSMGVAGLAALGLAVIFALWLLAGERQHVNRRYLSRSARNHHNLIEALRSLAVILGAAGLIVGSLAGLYAAMIRARPDLVAYLPYPAITFPMAAAALLLGGAFYAAGRFGR